jgi:predicted hydrocarbon binding protein
MCGFAKGLVHGVAQHYGQRVNVTESSCMERGDPTCSIRVKLEDSSA